MARPSCGSGASQAFAFHPNENWRRVICLRGVIPVPTNGIIPFPFLTSGRRGAVVCQADVRPLRTFFNRFLVQMMQRDG